MKDFCVLIFVALAVSATSVSAQDCPIPVKTQVETVGAKSRIIKLTIENDNSKIKVFLLNKGERAASEELSTREVRNVKAGVYEFIIIDTNREKCFREISVQVTEG